jgi:hypothetical protein
LLQAGEYLFLSIRDHPLVYYHLTTEQASLSG